MDRSQPLSMAKQVAVAAAVRASVRLSGRASSSRGPIGLGGGGVLLFSSSGAELGSDGVVSESSAAAAAAAAADEENGRRGENKGDAADFKWYFAIGRGEEFGFLLRVFDDDDLDDVKEEAGAPQSFASVMGKECRF